MHDGRPSDTARRVAAYRLDFARVPARFGDPEADDRLASDVAADVDVAPDERMAAYLRLRTSFFDRLVVNGLERGATQVALIGAGHDGRALRYAKAGVRWFEIDHPATQADKRHRLTRLKIATSNIAFLAADLAREDVADILIRAGFDPGAPSLMLCEGVLVYLDPSVVARLFVQLRAIAAAGTRIAVSGQIHATVPVRRERFAARVAELGEPLRLGRANVEQLLSAAHWHPTESTEGVKRAGLIIAVPSQEQGLGSTASPVGD